MFDLGSGSEGEGSAMTAPDETTFGDVMSSTPPSQITPPEDVIADYLSEPTRSEEMAERGGSSVPELDAAHAAFNALQDVDWTQVAADQLGEVLRDLAVLSARWSSIDCDVINAFDRPSGVRLHGGNIAGWLAAQTGVPRAEAGRRVRLAERLQHMPATRAAFAKGDIHFAHADQLGKTYVKPHLQWAFDAAERDDLVPVAERLRWPQFVKVVHKFEQVADPSQGENDEDYNNNRSEFRFSQSFDGMFRADGWIDPVSGEIIHGELQRIYQLLLDADWVEARAEHGDDARITHLARTAGQRMKDALTEMARRSAGSRKSAVPCINVHVDYQTLQQGMNELAGLPASYSADGIHETNAGIPIPVHRIVELAFHGHVRRLVFDGDGQVLDFGQRKRFFTGSLRESVELRDRHCQHPGCDLPAVFCEVDHIIAAGFGGPTSVSNGQLLCGFHNRQKGNRHFTPWWDEPDHKLHWLTHPPI